MIMSSRWSEPASGEREVNHRKHANEFSHYSGPYLLVLKTGDLRSQFAVWVNSPRN